MEYSSVVLSHLLLTDDQGTPLQNNARELFNLLQFIDPAHRAEALEQEYQDIDNQKAKEIHQLIRPYILKRTKAQVLKFLPPLGQVIVPVSMTVLQEKLAQATLQRNPELIEAVLGDSQVNKKDRKSLNNILMELRKIICHPYCFNRDVEVRGLPRDQEHEQLVTASGKLVLLSIMLPKLKARGHRVLIFSQFLENLTILEDFLAGIGLSCLRIDGSDSSRIKQKKIDDYNRPESPIFAMLLSTRAGGVGINLATADTVIIYDPDYNPHQDLQAISRAHRIGQQNKVLCFQLVTDDSVEALTMQAGRKKMALDHALIDKMDDEDDGAEDVESILKKGAAALFAKERKKIVHDSASVDKLLDRSNLVSNATDEDESTENQFSFARVWEGDDLVDNKFQDESDVPVLDADEWTRILKEREAAAEASRKAKQVELGRGARRKGKEVCCNSPYPGHHST